MANTPPDSPPDPRAGLRACLLDLQRGPWKFILLRNGPLGEEAIDGDDIDLLGARASVEALLDAALGWVRAGRCHVRVRATQDAKVALGLLSTDGGHQVELDLWIELRQLDNRRRMLTYETCAAAATNPEDAIQRLPVDLEASIFLHHLVARRKRVDDPKQQARLAAYVSACRGAGHAGLAEALAAVATANRVDAAAQALTLRLLEQRFPLGQPSVLRRALAGLRAAWLAPRASRRVLTLMGCDGCGKTSLGRLLAARRKDAHSFYTGKHLYRKSVLYKLLVIFVRPLLFQGREKFDDTFAPLAYLLACVRLRLKCLRPRRGVVLIDRSLLDFLYLARKTDTPRFSGCLGLARVFGIRVPHIHLLVPFERLRERKQEMTQAGHAAYDAAMFRHFTRRCPTDYLAFDNRGTLEESAAALDRILDRIRA
jgi:hypothetical protein